MLKMPIEIDYKNEKDGQLKTRRVVPFGNSHTFENGHTCITGFDPAAGGIRRFLNSNILAMRSVHIPVSVPNEMEKHFKKG